MKAKMPRIDEELRKLIPPLKSEELAKLEESIRECGVRDPLVVWKERGVLLDGHHRHRIATELGIAYKTRSLSLKNRAAAKLWMINNQLARRNLTPDQFRWLLGTVYSETVGSEGAPQGNDNAKKQRAQIAPVVSGSHATARKIASQHGVDQSTVRRAYADVKTITEKRPDLAQKIVAGESTIRQAKSAIDAETRKSEAAEQIRTAEGRGVVEEAEFYPFSEQFEQGSIDLLLTDPPYSTEIDQDHRWPLQKFSSWVKLWLPKVKPTGRAYIFTGAYPHELQAYLDHFLGLSDGDPNCVKADGFTLHNILVWTYRNTLGPTPKLAYKLNWQACFYLSGPEAEPLNCPSMVEQFSVQDINAPDGRVGDRHHAWQKPLEIAERFIRHSTKPGDLVVDPFAGTGSFIAAAKKLGRDGRGAEPDPAMLDICESRGLEVKRAD